MLTILILHPFTNRKYVSLVRCFLCFFWNINTSRCFLYRDITLICKKYTKRYYFYLFGFNTLNQDAIQKWNNILDFSSNRLLNYIFNIFMLIFTFLSLLFIYHIEKKNYNVCKRKRGEGFGNPMEKDNICQIVIQ